MNISHIINRNIYLMIFNRNKKEINMTYDKYEFKKNHFKTYLIYDTKIKFCS